MNKYGYAGKYAFPFFLAVLVGACGLVGFYELFSNFRMYDDEGLLMLSSQLFLKGYVFYKETPWIYGPIQLLSVQVLHDWLSVPITHSAVRFLTLAVWLLLSAVSGFLVYKLTRCRAWALASFILAFLFSGSIVNEPGHPQGMIAIITILIPLIPCLFRREWSWMPWLLIGGAAAVVANMKLNAGIFCVAAVSVILASQFRPVQWRALLRLGIVAGSFLFPFLLMFPLLADANCLGFAFISACSVAAVAVIAPAREMSGIQPGSATLASLVGFSIVTAGALAFVGQYGASVLDILSSLLGYAASQVDYYHLFRDYSLFQITIAGASLILVLGVVKTGDSLVGRRMITLGKAGFGLAALYAFAINDAANAQAMLGYAGPWCWLAAINRQGESPSTGRLLLAATAAWAPLLAYPIPGSQLYFGSLPVLLAAIVCSSDVLQLLPSATLRGYSPGRIVSVIVLFVALGSLYWHYKEARKQYYHYQPLALPGTEFMRIEPPLAKNLRNLVSAVGSADVVLTTFRFNSLYLWTHAKPPVESLLSHARLKYSSTVEQHRIVSGLQLAEHPVIVMQLPEVDEASPSGILLWIRQNFEPYRRVGPYILMRRRASVPPGTSDLMSEEYGWHI